jgi:parallel beta-helix repeat protein
MDNKKNQNHTITKSLLGYFLTLTLFLCLISNANGKNYYFSTSTGVDTRTSTQAQNPATPWKTITKLNSFFSSLLPGDSVLFKKGEVFYGSIVISKSGTAALPIVIGAYGVGQNPVISGFSTLTSWSNEGNGIYSTTISGQSSPDLLVINNKQYGMGRFPNSGINLTVDSHITNISITDAALNSNSTNWTGAEVVIRKRSHVLDRCKITNHTNQKLTYTNLGTTLEASDNYHYFIQNDLRTLDMFGEWFYNGSKLFVFMGVNNPTNYLIKFPTIDKTIIIPGYKYITLTNLTVEGSNNVAISYQNNSEYGVIKNCTVNFSGQNGVFFESKYGLIDNSFIYNVNRNGIETNSSFLTVTNNTIKNCGVIPGSTNVATNSNGIYAAGTDNLFQYNKIDSVTNNGIQMAAASRTIIKNNSISYFSLNLNDAGGIYTGGNTQTGRVIEGNIVLNGVGDLGTTSGKILVEGIYLDELGSNCLVKGNTIANCPYSGIKLHRAYSNTIRDNTCYNNYVGLRLQESNATDTIYNLVIKNNLFIANNAQYALMFNNTSGKASDFGIADSNYYARPVDDDDCIYTSDPLLGGFYRTLPSWKQYSGQDINSKKSPISIPDVSYIRFEYNDSKENKTIALNGNFIDFKGTSYSNSITLQPYTSVVLLKSNTGINQPPTINNQTFSISEFSPNGTFVGAVVASDPNVGQTLTYSILSGNLNNAFSLNASTGVLTVATSLSLNFQSTPVFSLVVKVQDNGIGNLSNQATITVNLISNTICSATGNITYDVWNNIGSGTSINILTSNSNYPNSPTSSSVLTSMEAPKNQAENFGARMSGYICAPSTGNYTFWISSDDNAELWLSSNNLPSNKQKIAFHLGWTYPREWNKYSTQKSTSIYLIEGQSYYIEALMKEDQVSDNFAVGWLKPGQTGTGPSEVIPGSVLSPLGLVINLPPVIVNQSFSVNENTISGTNIGTVIANDPNPGQTLTFSILSGNTNNAFTINSLSGVLSVASTSALNYEAATSFSLIIKVQDNGEGNLSSEATIIVNVLNINESPSISNQSFSINENAENGEIVGSIIASDPDSGQTLTYSIISGNTNNAFFLNPSIGVLSVNNSTALNPQVSPSFSLIIKVQDNGTNSLSNQAIITIVLTSINACSASGSITYQVWNNIGSGTGVSILTSNSNYPNNPTSTTWITSMEAPKNQAENFGARIAGYICAPISGNYTFWISSDDNAELWLSTNSQSLNKQKIAYHTGWTLPREWNKYSTQKSAIINLVQGQTYYIEALMKENVNTDNFAVGWLKPGQSGTGPSEVIPASVLAPLQAITNLMPVINNQSFAIAENSATGTNVGTVIASDPDAGQILTFSILSGNTNTAFAINASTGVLTVANSSALNFEVTPSFSLLIKVQDNGTGFLSSQATVTVSLININEVPTISNQAFSINENSANGTNVGNVIASDPDAGQTLTYSILSGNTSGAFTINASTGVLTVANSSALNFEVTPSFSLLIKVQDNGTGLLSSQATVTVSLININEVPTISNQAFSINENSANGTNVGNVIASDTDAGQTLTYSILSGNTSGAFTINASTGILTVANSSVLNFEVTPLFSLIIKVQDNGAGNMSNQAQVNVSLQNVNEIPIINNQTFTLNENSPSGASVGVVSATDPDLGQTLTFTIVSGNTNNAFLINATSGILTVANAVALNIQINPVFSLVIKAQDNGTGNLSNQGIITVNLTSVNACSATGNITYQVWENISGTSVIELTSNINYPNNPSSTTLISSMETLKNQANNFGARMIGYICAPVSGNYLFWIASDDNAELWLSTNSQSLNKQKIAFHTGWTYPREWYKYPTQKSSSIYLVAGQTYFIEALMKENVSTDNFAVAWLKPGQTGPGPSEVIPGSVLAPIDQIVTNGSLPTSNNTAIGSNPLKYNTTTKSSIDGILTSYGKVKIYPNPVNNGILNISFENTISDESIITVIDQSGRELINNKIADKNNHSIDVSILPPGIYLLLIRNKFIQFSNKFIVN